MTDGRLTILIVISSSVIIVNIIEICILIRKRKTWTNYDRLLLSLSFADLLVGITFFCFQIVRFHRETEYLEAAAVVFWYSITTSLLHVVLLTIDRATAVLYPLKHRFWFTVKSAKISIVMTWLSSIVMVAPLVIKTSKMVSKTVLGYMTVMIIFILVIVYSIIVYKAVIKRYRGGQTNPSMASFSRRDYQLVIVSIFIAASFAAFTLPFAIDTMTHKNESFSDRLTIVVNSLVNPIIYFFWAFLQRCTQKAKVTTGSCTTKWYVSNL